MPHASQLVLSKVALGTMGFADHPQPGNVRDIHLAIDHGMTTIDTAPLYGAGRSEEIVGEAISDRRDRVQVLTKCGLRWDTDHGAVLFTVTRNGRPWSPRTDSRPDSLMEEIDQCLKRLKTDYIDLMQVHQLDRETPISETMETLDRARTAGKIRAIGVSNFPVKQVVEADQALSGGLYSTQDRFNMIQAADASEMLRVCAEHALVFLAYSPLAHGVLAGRHLQSGDTPPRTGSPYFHPKNIERVSHVLTNVALPLAQDHGLSLGQLTLLWTYNQPGISSAIAGARTQQQVLDCAGALTAKVPPEDLKRLGESMRRCGWDPTPDASLPDRAKNMARRGKKWLGRLARERLS